MFTGISLGVVVAIIAVIALLGIIASGYVKAPPDTASIISGLRKKIIIGKSSIKIPFLERLDKLSLKLIPIDVKTEAAVPTADYINIEVDAAVNVKVSSEPEKLKQAAENFLNQNTQYIAQVAREVLEGNMREIVGRMRLEEMVSDRQKFADLVKENAEPFREIFQSFSPHPLLIWQIPPSWTHNPHTYTPMGPNKMHTLPKISII